MSTIHNEAKKGDIAATVLMPGDPLRAKYLAETFLEDAKVFNTVRGMLGYTGYYKGKRISVMGSGMGMPSIGLYSYELYNFYDVKSIIRIGSCGAYSKDLHVRDLVIAQGVCTDSNYASQFGLPGTFSAISSFDLLDAAVTKAREKNLSFKVGNIVSSDVFYSADEDNAKKWASMGCLGVEMESYALYVNAAYAGKKALTILTVSDHLFLEEKTTSEERQKTFTDMMEIALEIADE